MYFFLDQYYLLKGLFNINIGTSICYQIYRNRLYKHYYCNGQLHRIDGPAVEGFDKLTNLIFFKIDNTSKQDYSYSNRHRENGQDIESISMDRYWYLNGLRHRSDGPAIESLNGDKEWYLNGQRHRIGGPAIEYHNGYKSWYLNGKKHRIDGPAIEGSDGDKAWWLNGIYLSQEEWFERLSEEDKLNAIWNLR
jgi:hypothetical protein